MLIVIQFSQSLIINIRQQSKKPLARRKSQTSRQKNQQNISLYFLTALENSFCIKYLSFDSIQIRRRLFQIQKTLITMNIKKALGFGLFTALVSCDTFVQGAACTHGAPQSTIFVGTIPQGYGLLSGPKPQGPSGSQGQVQNPPRPQGPSSSQGQGQNPPPRPQSSPPQQGQGQCQNPPPRPSGPPSSQGQIVSDVAVTSSTGHVHTDGNKAGGHPKGDISKHRWTSANGEPHESEESVDKEGNHHQVHRWTNLKGLSHETDHWHDDKTGKTHQCHRWIDEEGTTHEAVHVTSEHGDPVSEHFIKDKEGHIKKIQWKKGDNKAKNEEHSDDEKKGKKKADGKGRNEKDGHDEHRLKRNDEDKHKHDDDSDTEHRHKHEDEHKHKQDDDKKRKQRSEKESKSEGHGPIIKPGSIVHSADCAAGKPNLSTRK